jgi:hypothetical protein
MSCLNATFTLTPLSPFHWVSEREQAYLFCYGSDFS